MQVADPRGFGQFIFLDCGSTGKYFRGAGEQAHNFRDVGSPVQKLIID